MKSINTISGLRRELHKIRSVVAGDTAFCAQAILFLAETLKVILDNNRHKQRRKLSDWQVFLGDKMRAGYSVQEAAKEWKKKPNHGG